jgi:hypothetical protein
MHAAVGGNENYKTLAELQDTMTQNYVSLPYLLPTKYGCGGSDYASCVSRPENSSDATTQVVWNLTRNDFMVSLSPWPLFEDAPQGGACYNALILPVISKFERCTHHLLLRT